MSNSAMQNNLSMNNSPEMVFTAKMMMQNFVPSIADKTEFLFKAIHSEQDMKFNGEDFSLVHLNGNNLTSVNKKKISFSDGHILAISKEDKKENEMEDVLSSAFLGAIFGGFTDLLKYAVKAGEGAQMLESDVKTKSIDSIINVNTKATVNSSLAFIASSPFAIEKKPTPELWQQRRTVLKNKEDEVKRKKYKMSKGI